MKIQDALKDTGKAKREKWGVGEFVYLSGMYFHQANGEPFCREDIAGCGWFPYHDKSVIRPEKAGELWKHEDGAMLFIRNRITSDELYISNLAGYDNGFEALNPKVIHNQNGWTRLFPEVPDESVERIEVEHIIKDEGAFFLRTIYDEIIMWNDPDKPSMKMTLEWEKGKSHE